MAKKPLSTTTVLATAAGLASSVVTDPLPPLLVLQCSSSSLGSGGNGDGEEEVFSGLGGQVTSLSTKRFSQESRNTEEIFKFLKMGKNRPRTPWSSLTVQVGTPVRPHKGSLFPGGKPLHHLLLLGLRSGSSQLRPPRVCLSIL